MIDLPHAFLMIAREVKEKRFAARVIQLGMRDDVVTLVLNPALECTVPSAARRAVDSLRAKMRAGRFAPPATPR